MITQEAGNALRWPDETTTEPDDDMTRHDGHDAS
jgi:hypothetical protein